MKRLISVSFVAFVAVATASAQVVSATESVSGSSGDYLLDFTFYNNTNDPSLYLYFMGVALPDGEVGAPGAYGDDYGWDGFNPSTWLGYGPNVSYDSTWIGSPGIYPGQSLGGFDILYTGATAPTSVDWFAYGLDPTYSYDGQGSPTPYPTYTWNPGFFGASVAAVPGPAAALSFGLLALRRRRKA